MRPRDFPNGTNAEAPGIESAYRWHAAEIVPKGKRAALSIRRRPGVRIAHIGDVDAPEVGRIARDFRKRGEENGADLSV